MSFILSSIYSVYSLCKSLGSCVVDNCVVLVLAKPCFRDRRLHILLLLSVISIFSFISGVSLNPLEASHLRRYLRHADRVLDAVKWKAHAAVRDSQRSAADRYALIATEAAKLFPSEDLEDVPGYGGSAGIRCKKNRTLMLLYHGSGLVDFHVHAEREFSYACPDLCVVWEHTTSQKYFRTADVVQYSSGANVRRGHPQQLAMLFTMESPAHSPLGSPSAMGQFNLKRTYHLDSDVFAAYIPIGEKHLREVIRPPPVEFKDKVGQALAAIVSNCGASNNRGVLISKIMEGIEVHSFGSCLHNRNLPKDQLAKGSSLKIVSTYKFYLALENSLCQDYVTEKLWRALYHGAIPVVTSYNNSPNYTKFTPNPHAYINVEQFPSIKELVAYLKRVSGDEQLYRSHLRHRFDTDRGAVSEEYRLAWGVLADRRRYCQLARRMLASPGLEALSKRRLTADTSCAPHGMFRGPVHQEHREAERKRTVQTHGLFESQ